MIRKFHAPLFVAVLAVAIQAASAQDFTGILGRPDNNSVTISLLSEQPRECYWEYGISPGNYTQQTLSVTAGQDIPLEAQITGLMPGTQYYYRMRYRATGSSGNFLAGPESTFHTCRERGTAFSFAVEADPHLDTNTNPDAYRLTLLNILDKSPDLMFDLGDSFMSEKLAQKTQEEVTARHVLYRSYFGSVCHSVPLFLVLGNHEGEQGWKLNGTSTSLPVMAAGTRKLYYPNPLPGPFYSGNEKPEEFVGLLQNYYAMEWGDALFIVLDPYWYTTVKPGWGWTLGADQYRWFREVLEGSTARFRFVFCHQLVGGDGNDARGGAEFADFFEMGGKNADHTWGFDENRPGWGRPIHQLMVDHHVNVFFHGHDHCYAKQDKDGVVYQEVPQPSSKNISNFTGAQYGYITGTLFPGRGFLLVTISDTTAKAEYIRTYLPSEENATRKNGEVAHTYTLRSTVSGNGGNSHVQGGSAMLKCAPNPAIREAVITYRVDHPGMVRITLCDPAGRTLFTPVEASHRAGTYTVRLDRDAFPAAPGVYLCRMTAGGSTATIKLMVR